MPTPPPLFRGGPPEEFITDLAPVERGRWVSVKLGRRVAARLRPATIKAMGLEVGAAWTEELAEQVAAAAEQDQAIDTAERALARKPHSRRELIELLLQHGFAPELAEAAAEDLARRGHLADRTLAEGLARAQAAKGPRSRAAIEEKLRRRGLDEPLVRRAVEEATGGQSDAQRALALARERVGKLAASLDRNAIARRVYGLLARRGFNEETARDAVERALAEHPELEGEP